MNLVTQLVGSSHVFGGTLLSGLFSSLIPRVCLNGVYSVIVNSQPLSEAIHHSQQLWLHSPEQWKLQAEVLHAEESSENIPFSKRSALTTTSLCRKLTETVHLLTGEGRLSPKTKIRFLQLQGLQLGSLRSKHRVIP